MKKYELTKSVDNLNMGKNFKFASSNSSLHSPNVVSSKNLISINPLAASSGSKVIPIPSKSLNKNNYSSETNSHTRVKRDNRSMDLAIYKFKKTGKANSNTNVNGNINLDSNSDSNDEWQKENNNLNNNYEMRNIHTNNKSSSNNKVRNLFNNNLANNNLYRKDFSNKNLVKVDKLSFSPIMGKTITKNLNSNNGNNNIIVINNSNIVNNMTNKSPNSINENYKGVAQKSEFKVHSSESLHLPNLYDNNNRDKIPTSNGASLRNSDSRKKIMVAKYSKNAINNNFVITKNIPQSQNNHSNQRNLISRANAEESHNNSNNNAIDLPRPASKGSLIPREEEGNERNKFYSTLNQGSVKYNMKFKRDNNNLAFGIHSNNMQNINQVDTNKFEQNKLSLSNFAFKTQAGKTELGQIKTNQDSYLVVTKVFNLDYYSIFGVLDGHGVNGHHVSIIVTNFLKDFFSSSKNYTSKNNNNKSSGVNKHPNNLNSIDSHELDLEHINEEIIYERLKENNYEIIRNAFYNSENEMTYSKYDINFSGCTCNIVFLIGDRIICANAGDSRAIIVYESKRAINTARKIASYHKKMGNFEAENLSFDHKPELENEKSRIISSGGRVDKVFESGYESGPFRVWVKGENYPGLAMSRSIGDKVAESVGVICDPDVIEAEITDHSRYIVIASDGVWEFIDSAKIISLVSPFYAKNDPNGACDAIVKESIEWWEKEDVVIDDITVIVVFLNCK